MNQFINQPVVNWARQSLPQPVKVKLKVRSQILPGLCFALLALAFLGIPLLFYISAISTFLSEGWSQKVSGDLFGGTITLAILGAFTLGIFFLMRLIRQKVARILSAEGVETRGRQRFGWQDLHFLDYKVGTYKSFSTRFMDDSRNDSLFVSSVKAVLYAGVKKAAVEMVFANGKAVVPPLIQNQPEILALLNSIPVQRRYEGKIRQ